ncbi:hypothetical protein J4410_03900 [Candidatus Woesearchaeota archaeon]|nr:hypothetical protein [Candidatus Woesearchaeota archaeon]
MMKSKTIGLCVGNIQRSATFEAVMNHALQEQGIQDMEITSGGILVEKILSNQTPLHVQIRMLEAGLRYGLVRPALEERVREIVARGTEQEHTNEIRVLYGEVRPLVHGYNLNFRNQALSEVGITSFPKPYKPFDPKLGWDLILPMVERDVGKVEQRYHDARLTVPILQTYGSLVGREELPDRIHSELTGAREVVTYFMDTRRKAIERIREVYRK